MPDNPRAVAGDNSSKAQAHKVVREVLKAFVERIERLEDEKKAISDDIRDVFSEARANGFDVKALRKIIAIRKMDPEEREELDALVETYMHALGMSVFA